MTYEEALVILGDAVRPEGIRRLRRGAGMLLFDHGWERAELDECFTADELEAIAVYMRAHGPENSESEAIS